MVAGETRNADAIAAASKPSIACSIKGAIDRSIAGARMRTSGAGARRNLRRRFRRGVDRRREVAGAPSIERLCARRFKTICRRRATASSHASGFSARLPWANRPAPWRGLRQRILGARDVVACAPRDTRRACHAAARHRFGGGARGGHRPKRANLDRAVIGAGAARRPGQRRIEIGHPDHVVAAELLSSPPRPSSTCVFPLATRTVLAVPVGWVGRHPAASTSAAPA